MFGLFFLAILHFINFAYIISKNVSTLKQKSSQYIVVHQRLVYNIHYKSGLSTIVFF